MQKHIHIYGKSGSGKSRKAKELKKDLEAQGKYVLEVDDGECPTKAGLKLLMKHRHLDVIIETHWADGPLKVVEKEGFDELKPDNYLMSGYVYRD